MSEFINAPSSNTYRLEKIINNQLYVFEVKTQDQHIYPQATFNDNRAPQAMQREGLWHGNDFRVNGLQLPSEIRVVSINNDTTRGTTKLRPQDRKSSDKLWVVEVIAPFGGAEEMVKDLKAKVFPGREVRYLAVGRDGRREVRGV